MKLLICYIILVHTASLSKGQTTEDPLIAAIEEFIKSFADGTTTTPSPDLSGGVNNFFDGISLDLFTSRPSTESVSATSSPAPTEPYSSAGLTVEPSETAVTPRVKQLLLQQEASTNDKDYTSILSAIVVLLAMILAVLLLQLYMSKTGGAAGKGSDPVDDLEENVVTVSSCAV